MKLLKILFLVTAFSMIFTQCYYWTVPWGLRDLRKRIEQAEQKELRGTASYHLTLAKELFQAAKKQYEEADFSASSRFIKQATEQLKRANELNRLTPR